MTNTPSILKQSLERLKDLYRSEGLVSPPLCRIVVKPAWNIALGEGHLCGIAMNFTGFHELCGYPRPSPALLRRFIGRDLFSVADEGIVSSDVNEVSVAAACMSALSQALLTEEALASRGLCAVTDWDLRQELTPDDVVTVVGYGGAVRQFLGRCRELHVTDIRPRESFQNIVIDEEVHYGPHEVEIHGEDENEAVLGRSDVVMLTGSSLINGTFDDLMRFATKARIA